MVFTQEGRKKMMESMKGISEDNLIVVTYITYIVLFVAFFMIVVSYFWGKKLFFSLSQVLACVGGFFLMVVLLGIGMPIEGALAAFFFNKAFVSKDLGKFLEEGSWSWTSLVSDSKSLDGFDKKQLSSGPDCYSVDDHGKFIVKSGGSGKSLSPMGGFSALCCDATDLEPSVKGMMPKSFLEKVHCEPSSKMSPDFLGHDKAFDWFECVRSGARDGYYNAKCHKEWTELFKYLICDDFYSKGVQPSSKALVLMKPEDIPEKPGYDKVVKWYECMRKKCHAGEDGYNGYGSGHPLSLVDMDCSKEWAELSVYLNGADRQKPKSVAESMLDSGFSVSEDEDFMWDDSYSKFKKAGEPSQEFGGEMTSDPESYSYDELLVEYIMADEAEESFEATDMVKESLSTVEGEAFLEVKNDFSVVKEKESPELLEVGGVVYEEQDPGVFVEFQPVREEEVGLVEKEPGLTVLNEAEVVMEEEDVVKESSAPLLQVAGESPVVAEVVAPSLVLSPDLEEKAEEVLEMGAAGKSEPAVLIPSEGEGLKRGLDSVSPSSGKSPESSESLGVEVGLPALDPSFCSELMKKDPRFLLLQKERDFFLEKLNELEDLGSFNKKFRKSVRAYQLKVSDFFIQTFVDMEAELVKTAAQFCEEDDLNIEVLKHVVWYIDGESTRILEECRSVLKTKARKLRFIEFLAGWEAGQEVLLERAMSSSLPKEVNAMKSKMLLSQHSEAPKHLK